MQSDEIKHSPDYGHGDFDPCGVCLEIIGEVFSDPLDEDEVSFALAEEWSENIDNEKTP